MSRTPVNPSVTAITAFFPCYDDEATIGRIVDVAGATLDALGVDGEIIVVNDGSSDGSAKVLHDVGLEEPRLRVVEHEHNRGYGGALLSGFANATKEWVFYTDGDAQFDPAELARLVAAASAEIDWVQGYKIHRSDSLARRIVGRVYHRFVALMFGLKIRDTDCDFRLIRREVVQSVGLEHTSGVICVEMVRKLQDVGARVVEVPVHHYPRLHGTSQFFNVRSVYRSLRDLAVLWVRMVARRQRALASQERV